MKIMNLLVRKEPAYLKEVQKRLRELSYFFLPKTEIKLSVEEDGTTVSLRQIPQDFWSSFEKTRDFSKEEPEFGFEYAYANSKYQVFTRLIKAENPNNDMMWLSIKTHGILAPDKT